MFTFLTLPSSSHQEINSHFFSTHNQTHLYLCTVSSVSMTLSRCQWWEGPFLLCVLPVDTGTLWGHEGDYCSGECIFPGLTSSFCVSGKFQCELNSPSSFLSHYFQTHVQKRVKGVKNDKGKDTSPTASLLTTYFSKCTEQFNVPSNDASSSSPRVPDLHWKVSILFSTMEDGPKGATNSTSSQIPGDPEKVIFLLCMQIVSSLTWEIQTTSLSLFLPLSHFVSISLFLIYEFLVPDFR